MLNIQPSGYSWKDSDQPVVVVTESFQDLDIHSLQEIKRVLRIMLEACQQLWSETKHMQTAWEYDVARERIVRVIQMHNRLLRTIRQTRHKEFPSDKKTREFWYLSETLAEFK